jgi:hypothetical protein
MDKQNIDINKDELAIILVTVLGPDFICDFGYNEELALQDHFARINFVDKSKKPIWLKDCIHHFKTLQTWDKVKLWDIYHEFYEWGVPREGNDLPEILQKSIDAATRALAKLEEEKLP